MYLILQCAAIYVLSSVLWRVLQRFFLKTELDDIPGPPSESFLKGSFPKLFNVNGWGFHRMIWDSYGSVVKLKGALGENILYIYDPKALHCILVKDQNLFLPSPSNLLNVRLIFGNGLLATIGEHHKKQRKLLNPVFSINHMRGMIPIFYDITDKLEKSILNKVKIGAKEIDMVFWMGRTALELIGQSGFGHSFDDLSDSEDYDEHSYSTALKQIVPATFSLAFLRTYLLQPVLRLTTPSFRRWAMASPYLPFGDKIRKVRDLVEIVHQTSLEIYQHKKSKLMSGDETVKEQVGRGKDILSILMRENMEADEEDKLDEEEIYGQISTFTFAGMDTTSNALSRTLWLLAQHPRIQSNLRTELRAAQDKLGSRTNTRIPYDDLVSLPLLDAICRETMRLYPPVPQITRETTQDTILPISQPITLKTGRTISEILVPKGTKCVLSMMGSNLNTAIWGADAHEWKPERWLNTMKEEVVGAKIPGIYSHLMTFSAGSRACIGFKFSQLEMKVVLATLVSRFDFTLATKEIAWQMTGVVIPVVANGDPSKPCMPLMVKLAD